MSTDNTALKSIGSIPISSYELASSLRPTSNIADLLAIQSIRDTLALYPLALDGRNYDILDKVFVHDVQATYMEPLGTFSNVQDLKSGLAKVLSGLASTQHNYGTQLINVLSPTTAVSVTYIHASHFMNPGPIDANVFLDDGNVFYGFAQYQDSWARQGDGLWKITNRITVFMVRSPSFPELDIFLCFPSCRPVLMWCFETLGSYTNCGFQGPLIGKTPAAP